MARQPASARTASRPPPAARQEDRPRNKRLAVFCDGTWNDLSMADITNVARLAKCVSREGWDGKAQVVFYDAGVGVKTGVSPFVDRLVGLLGGALGRGIDEKIEAAYRFLVMNYEPGDEIFVFGFSRGAYTARSLVGLIRKCGILRRDCLEQIPAALKHYRSRTPPHDSDLIAFRADYGNRVPGTGRPIATGQEDLSDAPVDTSADAEDRPPDAWTRRVIRLADVDGATPDKVDKAAPEERPEEIYRLLYVGLWDTVGSLGLPSSIPFISTLTNRKYKFHDTRASSLIASLRHACALDEDRKVFDITEVSNIDKLNAEWAAGQRRRDPGRRDRTQVDFPGKAGFVPYWERPFQQQWFPGSHGSVGGGNKEHGLSSGALVWIAVGAMRAGLKFEWGGYSELARAKNERTPYAEWRIRKDGSSLFPWEFDFLGFLTGYRDRKGPKTREEISWAALQRMENPEAKYRPATLKRFTGSAQPTPLYRTVARIAGFLTLVALAALAWWIYGHWDAITGCVSRVICRG